MRISADPARRRRLFVAAAVYAAVSVVMLAFAPREILSEHTPYNHFALLARSLLDGRLDLGGAPPAYTGNNDFALHDGETYVVFPPFPALLLLPIVALAGAAENVADGLFFLCLAGIGPALLFLALEKLRRERLGAESERESVAWSLLFAFGSVYFFSAVQGTVWFAAHVVGVALAALYLLCAIRAERPLVAGLALGLAFATRAPLLFAAPLFVLEAVRASAPADACPLRDPFGYARAIDRPALARRLALFALPVALVAALLFAYNAARFGDPLEFGYRYLTVVWRARIEKWGLFDYHYLAKNLGAVLTSLPWIPGQGGAPFTINHHGLALWVTTPLYLLLLRPRRSAPIRPALIAAALLTALPSLFYQNTGWIQFGYRFSNDYAVFLFALFAASGVRLGRLAAALALVSVLVNGFGARTFGRPEFSRFYFTDPTQRVLYQPD